MKQKEQMFLGQVTLFIFFPLIIDTFGRNWYKLKLKNKHKLKHKLKNKHKLKLNFLHTSPPILNYNTEKANK